jgi:hypothetical protein
LEPHQIINMAKPNLNYAEKLQSDLLNKGFKRIELCDIEDDGVVEIKHYTLSKADEPSKPDSCLYFHSIDLNSEQALNVLENWMNQIMINPDPRRL